MTCGQCFHGPGVNSPMTLREHAHGKVSTEKGSRDLYYTTTTSGYKGKDQFSFFSQTAGIRYVSSFSICPFIFRCLEKAG